MPDSPAAIARNPASPAPVGAVIVAYNPDLPVLQQAVSIVESQVSKVILLDNGSPVPVAPRLSLGTNSMAVRLPENLGLGAAQNRGVEEAVRHGCKLVLFLDQDSLPSQGMVGSLIRAWEVLSSQDSRIAAVGPRHIDARQGAGRPGINGEGAGAGGSSVAYRSVDFLLSSGSLVPVGALDDVGLMDPSLFIDSTDRDWCFRAIHKGYKLYRCEDSTLTHRLGDRLRCIWPIPKVYEAVHQPQRLYFMMRNRVLLYRRTYVPLLWIVADIPRALGKIALTIIFGPERWSRLFFIMVGVRHGIEGRGGPYTTR